MVLSALAVLALLPLLFCAAPILQQTSWMVSRPIDQVQDAATSSVFVLGNNASEPADLLGHKRYSPYMDRLDPQRRATTVSFEVTGHATRYS